MVPVPVQSADGQSPHIEHESMMQKWAEHNRDFLNSPRDIGPSLLDELTDLPLIEEMDAESNLQKVKDAICVLHKGKAR